MMIPPILFLVVTTLTTFDCTTEQRLQQMMDAEYNSLHTESSILSIGNTLCDINEELSRLSIRMKKNADAHVYSFTQTNKYCGTKHDIIRWQTISTKMNRLHQLTKECK